ncbi:6-phosphofructokinase [Candidatus Woesearchaeota archaeon]|nr:6-phosphofructokinase [Candidatus Woesearchaeota archaeon]
MANLGVLIVDGDEASQNAILTGIVQEAEKMAASLGIDKVIGFNGGLEGLTGDYKTEAVPFTVNLFDAPIDEAHFGCVLTSSRARMGISSQSPSGSKGVEAENLKNRIDYFDVRYLIVISGIRGILDFRNALPYLPKRIKNIVFVEKSMNNDVGIYEEAKTIQKEIYNPGWGSAVTSIAELTNRIRIGSRNSGKINVLRLLGGITGWGPSGAKAGGADDVLIPEMFLQTPEKSNASLLGEISEELTDRVKGSQSSFGVYVAGVSEAVPRNDDELQALAKAISGMRGLGDFHSYESYMTKAKDGQSGERHYGERIAEGLSQTPHRKNSITYGSIDHLARWGAPTRLDVHLSKLYGRKAVRLLSSRVSAQMPFIYLQSIQSAEDPLTISIDGIGQIHVNACRLQPVPQGFFDRNDKRKLALTDEYLALLNVFYEDRAGAHREMRRDGQNS